MVKVDCKGLHKGIGQGEGVMETFCFPAGCGYMTPCTCKIHRKLYPQK